jgi:hypothetical protein
MRCASILLLLALVFTFACGSPMHDPSVTFGTGLTPPALNTLEPNTVPVNSVPFVMTVNGKNFAPGALLFWNKAPHSTLFLSPNQLQVSVTADDLMTFGLAQVYVQTGGMTSNTIDFDVTAQ